MPDVFTQAKRSQVMSRIRSRGNRGTELALAAVFRRAGITGWRRQQQLTVRSRRRQSAHYPPPGPPRKDGADSRPRLRVRPDFVFPKLRLAVFVDGCFWHACPIHATKPRNNAAFWRKKLAVNQARDRRVNRALRAAGWRVLRIWEHELKKGRRRMADGGNRIRKASTPHPGPLPVRGGEGEARLVGRLLRAVKAASPIRRPDRQALPAPAARVTAVPLPGGTRREGKAAAVPRCQAGRSSA